MFRAQINFLRINEFNLALDSQELNEFINKKLSKIAHDKHK